MSSDAWIWLGRNFPQVSHWFTIHVVAFQSGSSFSFLCIAKGRNSTKRRSNKAAILHYSPRFELLTLPYPQLSISIHNCPLICLLDMDSVTAQQIGLGILGLGLGSLALDWSTVAGFLGSPLATPGFAIVNNLVGFILVVYVVLPFAYWNNLYDAKWFPIIPPHLFDANGNLYNTSAVVIEKTFEFNKQGYDTYSKVPLTYDLSFATLAATISHVALFHRR